MGYAALQVGAEVREPAAILRIGAVAKAVGEDGFQQVALAARERGLFVQHQPGSALGNARRHDLGSSVCRSEAFLQKDSADQHFTACGVPAEAFAAAEYEIVRVACVVRFELPGESAEPGIQCERAQIC